MAKADIGLIGLAVMGQNLTIDMIENGGVKKVAVYNRTSDTTRKFVEERIPNEFPGLEGKIIPTYGKKMDMHELVQAVGPKGRYFLMVKAGKAVDNFIEKLLESGVTEGALIIDGGNSHFEDTIRRQRDLRKKGIGYIGTGVSGGEEGALRGPSIMPGGTKKSYNRVKTLFKRIAAKADQDQRPCVDLIGPNGAGHYVKMVHNAIEYGDMGMIGESAWFLKAALGCDSGRVGEEMEKWNADGDPLQSYLIQITADGLQQPDGEAGSYLVDNIADITRMKGTGLWGVESAKKLMVATPTIDAAVTSRMMSELKDLRLIMAEKIPRPNLSPEIDEQRLMAAVHNALYIGKIASYAQGIALMQKASEHYKWNLNMHNIPLGWRGGCIIRAQFLDDIAKAYADEKNIPENLIATKYFTEAVVKGLSDLTYVSSLASQLGIPIPVLDASKNYLLQLVSPVLYSASVQAKERDIFGAHGYFKKDKYGRLLLSGFTDPDTGKPIPREFHTTWMKPRDKRMEIEVTKPPKN